MPTDNQLIVDYATGKLRRMRNELAELLEILPAGPARDALCASHAHLIGAYNGFHWRPEDSPSAIYLEVHDE